MRYRRFVAAALVAGISGPALASGNPVDGLQAMRETNLIVLNNMTGGHDVEGKAFVGGNLSGNNTPVGIGASANPRQSDTASSRRTLTVGGNVTAGINLANGSGVNYASGSGPGVRVGGNLGQIDFNTGSAVPSIDVGGNVTGGNYNLRPGQTVNVGGNFNAGGGGALGATLKAGGSVSGFNANGATVMQNAGIGWNAASTSQLIAAERTKLTDDLRALSSFLGGLTVMNPSTVTMGGQGPILNAVNGGSGFALFNVSRTQLTGSELAFNVGAGVGAIIVNLTGFTGNASYNWTFNPVGGNNASLNQRVIWNFVDATAPTGSLTGTVINFQRMVHGSILAPNATISNTTPLEGSIVAFDFNQGGEVHLGTFNENISVVPEPGTWAMMIAGFGLVGSAMRRRRQLQYASA